MSPSLTHGIASDLAPMTSRAICSIRRAPGDAIPRALNQPAMGIAPPRRLQSPDRSDIERLPADAAGAARGRWRPVHRAARRLPAELRGARQRRPHPGPSCFENWHHLAGAAPPSRNADPRSPGSWISGNPVARAYACNAARETPRTGPRDNPLAKAPCVRDSCQTSGDRLRAARFSRTVSTWSSWECAVHRTSCARGCARTPRNERCAPHLRHCARRRSPSDPRRAP